MNHLACLQPVPPKDCIAPRLAALPILVAFIEMERIASESIADDLQRLSVVTAIKQLKLGHGTAAGNVIAKMPHSEREFLTFMCLVYGIVLCLMVIQTPPERHSLIKQRSAKGIVFPDMPGPHAYSGLVHDIYTMGDHIRRRVIELALRTAAEGDIGVLEHRLQNMSGRNKFLLRDLLSRHNLTIWDTRKGGELSY